MIVTEKNEGTKVNYEVIGDKITFGDDEITLNLIKYERDEAQTIDICRDDDKILIAGPSKYFVANINIPARQYEDQEKTTPIPFSMDNVELVLWALVEV